MKTMLICTTGYYTGLICGLYIDLRVNKYISYRGINNSYYCALIGCGLSYFFLTDGFS